MSRELLTILPDADIEVASGFAKTTPYVLRETLTITDAAMIYCDRPPRPAFFFSGLDVRAPDSIDEIERLIGKGAHKDHGPGTLHNWEKSWSVYCTILGKLEAQTMRAVRPVFDGLQTVNPILTEILLRELLELAQERGDAGQIIQSLLCWYADDETRSSVGRPTEQEPPESSLIKRLANWVFDQHPDQGAPQTKATLLKIAITRGIGDWDTSQFDEAYRLVYETKRGAPPITGWSLREPYKTRFVERKNRG